MKEAILRFYLRGKEFARRMSFQIPAVGDEIRFNNVIYKITQRVFIYDEESQYGNRCVVAYDIEKVDCDYNDGK